MTTFLANARMYAVTPDAEAAWRDFLVRVAAEAGLSLDYLPYPAPQPLDDLWARADLGCVQMCGYPIALQMADIVPIAAPIPAAPWSEGRPIYRTDLIVRADSPYATLEDAFRGTLGWTVEHSHSGFNALRHHLLSRRPPGRSTAFAATKGPLGTPRRILDSVIDRSIDIGPLDAYWHLLISRYRPDLAAQIRVLESTETAALPAFVASRSFPPERLPALIAAFEAASSASWFPPFADALCIQGFGAVSQQDYAPTLRWDQEALAAHYPLPA